MVFLCYINRGTEEGGGPNRPDNRVSRKINNNITHKLSGKLQRESKMFLLYYRQ